MARKNYSRKRRKQMIGGADFTQDQINELVYMGFNEIFPGPYVERFNTFKENIENVIYWYIVAPNNDFFTEVEQANATPDRIVDMLYNKYSALKSARNTPKNSILKNRIDAAIDIAKDKLVSELQGTKIYTFDLQGRISGPAIGFVPYRMGMGGGKRFRKTKTRRRYKK
jgi:hypothetical protein